MPVSLATAADDARIIRSTTTRISLIRVGGDDPYGQRPTAHEISWDRNHAGALFVASSGSWPSSLKVFDEPGPRTPARATTCERDHSTKARAAAAEDSARDPPSSSGPGYRCARQQSDPSAAPARPTHSASPARKRKEYSVAARSACLVPQPLVAPIRSRSAQTQPNPSHI